MRGGAAVMAKLGRPCYIERMPFDPHYAEQRRHRFRPIPVRMLVPNFITLLAIAAGLTAIRLSTEGRMQLAVAAIVFAAVLDGIDGRLRLARFNASIDEPNKPAFASNYFTGVPAPAGAVTALLPIYLDFLGLFRTPAVLTAVYTLLIAFLMVSRLPVFSGKSVRMRVPPELVLPVFVGVIFFIALLIGYPWQILSAGSVLYLLSLPVGWTSYRDHARAAAAAKAAAAPQANVAPPALPSTPTFASTASDASQDDRPDRLH